MRSEAAREKAKQEIVSEGLVFDKDEITAEIDEEEKSKRNVKPEKKVSSKIKSSRTVRNTDSTRKTKKTDQGQKETNKSKSGRRGRPSIPDDEKKVQYSITCTPGQKQLFREAAEKSGMRFPDFMNTAVEEYIDRHYLN